MLIKKNFDIDIELIESIKVKYFYNEFPYPNKSLLILKVNGKEYFFWFFKHEFEELYDIVSKIKKYKDGVESSSNG